MIEKERKRKKKKKTIVIIVAIIVLILVAIGYDVYKIHNTNNHEDYHFPRGPTSTELLHGGIKLK